MNNKKCLNLIGGGFQHAFSSCGYVIPTNIIWAKNQNISNITFYVDQSIINCNVDKTKNNFAWICESPEIVPDVVNHINSHYSTIEWKFEKIFTNCLDMLHLGNKMEYIIPHAVPWIQTPKIYDKTKLISIISSTKNFTTGHQFRNYITDQLTNTKVDIFGVGRNYVKMKEEGLIDYMFSFAIENTQKDGYFTEKITDCFATGTIPLYWGSSKQFLKKYFDVDGIIFMDESFDIDMITEDLYKSKQSSIKNNFDIVNKLQTPEDWVFEKYLQIYVDKC